MLLSANTIAENLRELSKLGEELSQPVLAKRMGLGSKTFWTMKEGTGNPQLENIEKAARYFRRPIWHLLIPGGHLLSKDFDPFKVPVPEVVGGHVRILVHNASPATRVDGEPVDYPAVLGHIDVAEGWARKHLGPKLDQIRAVPVAGDSMSPTINDGDLAFVDTTANRFEADGLYVLIWNGRLLIKRLVANVAQNHLEIRSDSPINPTQHIPANEIDGLHICGRVKAWLAVKEY